MEVAIFLCVLLVSIAIGIPIAFALMMCGLALMFFLDMFDPMLVAEPDQRLGQLHPLGDSILRLCR